MHFDFEAEHIGVKRDRRIDIVYDITNTDLAHIFTSENRLEYLLTQTAL
jgi:hypothetical protein